MRKRKNFSNVLSVIAVVISVLTFVLVLKIYFWFDQNRGLLLDCAGALLHQSSHVEISNEIPVPEMEMTLSNVNNINVPTNEVFDVFKYAKEHKCCGVEFFFDDDEFDHDLSRREPTYLVDGFSFYIDVSTTITLSPKFEMIWLGLSGDGNFYYSMDFTQEDCHQFSEGDITVLAGSDEITVPKWMIVLLQEIVSNLEEDSNYYCGPDFEQAQNEFYQ